MNAAITRGLPEAFPPKVDWLPITATMTVAPDDPDASPEQRLRVIAEQLGAMHAAGELDALPDDTRLALAGLPLVLFSLAAEVRQAMAPPPTRWARMRQCLFGRGGEVRS